MPLPNGAITAAELVAWYAAVLRGDIVLQVDHAREEKPPNFDLTDFVPTQANNKYHRAPPIKPHKRKRRK